MCCGVHWTPSALGGNWEGFEHIIFIQLLLFVLVRLKTGTVVRAGVVQGVKCEGVVRAACVLGRRLGVLEKTSRHTGDWSQSVTFITGVKQQSRLRALTARFSSNLALIPGFIYLLTYFLTYLHPYLFTFLLTYLLTYLLTP